MSWALYTGADSEQSQLALEDLMAAVEVFTLHVDHDLEVAQDVSGPAWEGVEGAKRSA